MKSFYTLATSSFHVPKAVPAIGRLRQGQVQVIQTQMGQGLD